MKLSFSMIDAKEYPVITVFSKSIDGRPKTRDNQLVVHKAERDYLSQLLQLQEQIKEKYESQLVEEVGDEEDYDSDEDTDFDWSNREFNNLYYT